MSTCSRGTFSDSAKHSRIAYHEQPSKRSSFGRKSKSSTSTGSPYSMVIFGKRKRSPLCFTCSALRTVMGRMGACPIFAMNAAPECSSGVRSLLPRRVPSGMMPTISLFFSMRVARLMAVRSAASRLMGNAPTRDSTWPTRPCALPNRFSRPRKRTHCEGRPARYINATSRNDVWLPTTTTPVLSLKPRKLSRWSTR